MTARRQEAITVALVNNKGGVGKTCPLLAADALPALLEGPKVEKVPAPEIMVPAAEVRALVETLTTKNVAKVRAQLLKMLEG